MLLAEASIRGMLDLSNKKLKVLKKRLEIKKEKGTEPDNFDASDINVLMSNCYDAVMYAEELAELSQRSSAKRSHSKVLSYIDELLNEKDSLEKMEIFACIFEELKDMIDSRHGAMFCEENERYRKYVDPNLYVSLSKKIKNRNKINVLNIDVEDGTEISFFKECQNQSMLYGVSRKKSKDNSVENAKLCCEKVALGGIRGGKISNEAFDVLLNTPRISTDYHDNYDLYRINKLEKVYLEECFKFSKDNALVITVLPHFRLTKDICLVLSRRLSEAAVYRLPLYNSDVKNIVIIGRSSKNGICKTDVYDSLRSKYVYSEIEEFNEDAIQDFEINNIYKEVDYFRGGVIDEDEILNFIKQDNFTDLIYKEQDVEKFTETKKRPLIPFKIGQIGLVLTSGCLDGIVDEGNGCFHMVKGMVSKQRDMSSSVDRENNTREDVTITSNRVEINLLMPNGDYKTLN